MSWSPSYKSEIKHLIIRTFCLSTHYYQRILWIDSRWLNFQIDNYLLTLNDFIIWQEYISETAFTIELMLLLALYRNLIIIFLWANLSTFTDQNLQHLAINSISGQPRVGNGFLVTTLAVTAHQHHVWVGFLAIWPKTTL